MKKTFKSLLSAVLSAALIGTANYAQTGTASLKGTGSVAAIGALVGLTNFFLKSPATPDAPKADAPKAE